MKSSVRVDGQNDIPPCKANGAEGETTHRSGLLASGYGRLPATLAQENGCGGGPTGGRPKRNPRRGQGAIDRKRDELGAKPVCEGDENAGTEARKTITCLGLAKGKTEKIERPGCGLSERWEQEMKLVAGDEKK